MILKSNNCYKIMNRLTEQEYEEDLYSYLESGSIFVLNSTMHICEEGFIPRNFTVSKCLRAFMAE